MRSSPISFMMIPLQLSLLLLAAVLMQVFIAGARPLYSIPVYGLISLTAILGLPWLWRSKRPAPSTVCTAAALIFGLFIAARAWVSPVPYLARTDLFLVLGSLLVYLLFAYQITDSTHRLWFVAGLLVFSLAHLFVGAIQVRDGQNFYPLPWINRADYGARASGFYICPNHLAGLFEILLAFGVSLLFWGKLHRALKVLVGYTVVLCLLGIAFTGSRGGYLSTVVTLLVFGGLSLWMVKRSESASFSKILLFLIVATVLVSGLCAFLFLNSELVKERASKIYEPRNMRVLLWEAALKQFQLAPTVGTGAGTYLYYGRQFRSPSVQNDPVFVHNDYLHLLAEYGVIGAVLGGAFLLLHCRNGWRSFLSLRARADESTFGLQSNPLALNLGALCAVAAYIAHSIVDFNLHVPANALLMGFVFAILARPSGCPPGPVATNVSRLIRLAVPLTAIFLLGYALPFAPAEYQSERARIAIRDSQKATPAAREQLLTSARTYAEAGLKIDPQNPYLDYYLGESARILALQQKKFGVFRELNEQAAAAFRQGLVIFPRDNETLLKLARTLDGLAEFDEAERVLKFAVEINPNLGTVHTIYGLHLQDRGLFSAAKLEFEKALSLAPFDAVAAKGLAQVKAAKARGVPDHDWAAD